MIKLMNKFFSFLKIILLLISFVMTLFILMNMYANLDKEPFGADFINFFSNLLPFIILLILIVINLVRGQKNVNNNVFYNLTSVLILAAIMLFGYRALFDQNMILWHKTNYKMNFEYFADQLTQIKVMLYALSVGNICLMIEGIFSNNAKENKIVD